jgi:hypothetical protein
LEAHWSGVETSHSMGCRIESKVELLKGSRIGLWDAYHSCIRPGSMDGDITEQELNDFELKSVARNIA